MNALHRNSIPPPRERPSGLYPRKEPRPTESQAERKLWAALHDQLPEGWVAWHAMQTSRPGKDAEGDFVIAVPGRGLLVVEVKGGIIEIRDGRWFSNGYPLRKDPWVQATAFGHELTRRIAHAHAGYPAFASVLALVDTKLDEDALPSSPDLAARILGAYDLPHLRGRLVQLAERLLPVDDAYWRDDFLFTLHDLFCERWVPRPTLETIAREDERERVGLDRQQLFVLDLLALNRTVLVDGAAGSGKSLLASEAARRRSRLGERVLLTCFTSALARHLDGALVDAPSIDVATVRELAAELLAQSGRSFDPNATDAWEGVAARALAEAGEALAGRWDTIVVDEAQDLTADEWRLLRAGLADGGRMWAFRDAAQAFFAGRRVPEEAFGTRARLYEPYRCPEALFRVACDCMGGRDERSPSSVRDAVQAGALDVVVTEGPVDRITMARLLDRLTIQERLRPERIAIVSLRGANATNWIATTDGIGDYPVVRADDERATSQVVSDTFLRFKGLERPVVVITDLEQVRENAEVRLHVALTRATVRAIVVAPRRALAAHPILRDLLRD